MSNPQTIYNIFKFLEDKRNKPIPLRVKLIHAPETLTKNDLFVEGNLNLQYTKIKSLPDNLHVNGVLHLGNTPISKLPRGLKVDYDLFIYNTLITSLPEDLKVGYNFWVYSTPLSEKYTIEQIAEMVPNINIDQIII